MTTWLVKAGFQGAIADKFQAAGKIAIGWEMLGDFPVDGDWAQFRAKVKDLLPSDYNAQRVGSAAGQLWAFTHDMQVGDFVISPIKISREVFVGKVTGEYEYDPDFDQHYVRTRTVQWFTPIPWDSISQELRNTFTAWQTISRPTRDFSSVIDAAQNAKTLVPTIGETEDYQSNITESAYDDLSEKAEDLIRQMLRELGHVDFQRIVGGIFAATGFTVLYDSAGRGRDGGVDLLLSKDPLGAGERIVVQVKHTGDPVGQPELQQLLGTLRPGEWGLMVSLSGIKSNSERYWRDNRDRLLKPIESSDLIQLLQTHYERLGDEYKTLLPLKRTYVPFTPEDS